MDWKATISAVAPSLATALGGPLAGIAAAAISDALLGKPDASEGEMATALMVGGTEALAKLKEADRLFALDCRRLDIEIAKLGNSDRASAREREIKTGDRWTPRILAFTIVSIWALIQYHVITSTIDSSVRELVIRLLGTLDAALMAVLYYYFGSSSSSQDKNDLIRKS